MSISGIHSGFLRKYGGFMFKQWKERYIVLTAEGCVLVCRDADSPADQVLPLVGCEAIVEGKEILDLPRLPPGGRRDCCLALILSQDKFLLLLAENPSDCSYWLNVLRKVKESILPPPLDCKRHQGAPLCISDGDPLPHPRGDMKRSQLYVRDKRFSTPNLNDKDVPDCTGRGSWSPRARGMKGVSPQRSVDCLRHGTSSDVRAVRAVYMLMGGAAAASSARVYLDTCSPYIHDARPANMTSAADVCDPGPRAAFHACSQDQPHYHSFDFEADTDFDAFDCGGFAF